MDRNPSVILKEQFQLVQAQKEIDKMIQLINGCLNEFLVENLQLKSNDVTKLINDTGNENTVEAKPINPNEEKEINKQSLNLNIGKALKTECVEEDDEDEDDEISSLSFLE